MAEIVTTSPEAYYLEQFKETKTDLGSLNAIAIKRFEELKFPYRKHEMYSFVNTKELASTQFKLSVNQNVDPNLVKKYILKGCEKSVVVFVNGHYNEGLSDISHFGKAIQLKMISQAISDSKVKDYLSDSLKREEDVFSAINGAFFQAGVYIKLSENAKIENPLHILYLSEGTNDKAVLTLPRVLVHLEKKSKLEIIVKQVGSGENFFRNSVQDFIVDEKAELSVIQLQNDPFRSWSFTKSNITLSTESRFHSTTASSGSKLTRQHYNGYIKGEKAELVIKGISVLKDQEESHNFVKVHHEAGNSFSDQIFRNILRDSSHASVDTTVVVHEGAQLTGSHQLINNLMLSDDAEADTKPNLIIHADDVKCAHGATIGQIAEDQLFYLISRGLPEKDARALLTSSFANVILEDIHHSGVLEEIKDVIINKLGGDYGN